MGGTPGAVGTGGTGGAGENSDCSSGTCPAGVHVAIPCCHTSVSAVSCRVGTNDFNVWKSYGPYCCPLIANIICT